ncbi:MAG: rhodanese-like domain-containing protein [Porphyromonas sp.]|nr:rhodanese-like domain-containing protein [Porphyromonas sp.]
MDSKKIIVALLSLAALVALLSFTGCKSSSQKEVSKKLINIEIEQLEELLGNPAMQLVDVRTQEEYDAGFIPGAVLIDVTLSDFTEKALKLLNPENPVLVYCRSGGRSLTAARILVSRGFTVYNLNGGYTAYVAHKKKS